VKKLAASQPVARNSGGDLYAAISLNLTAPSLLFALRKRRSLLLSTRPLTRPSRRNSIAEFAALNRKKQDG